MTQSYEEYQQEYNGYLSRIRSFLAGTRSRSTLSECDRLLDNAKKCAIAMQGLAEVEGNAMRVTEAKNLLERDIAPLSKEVKRALEQMGREELFYTGNNNNQNQDFEYSDMESLIRSSDDLLRDSRAVLADTEHIGTTTLHQMGRQREQLLNAHASLDSVRNAAVQARTILTSMSRRACRSRFALYVMILTLIMANLFVLYCIYKKHHKPNSQ